METMIVLDHVYSPREKLLLMEILSERYIEEGKWKPTYDSIEETEGAFMDNVKFKKYIESYEKIPECFYDLREILEAMEQLEKDGKWSINK